MELTYWDKWRLIFQDFDRFTWFVSIYYTAAVMTGVYYLLGRVFPLPVLW